MQFHAAEGLRLREALFRGRGNYTAHMGRALRIPNTFTDEGGI